MEKLATRVIFMEDGKIIKEIKDLKNLSSKSRYLLLVDKEENLENIFTRNKIDFKKDNYYDFVIEKDFLNHLLYEIIKDKILIKDLIKKEFSLEDLYLETIQR